MLHYAMRNRTEEINGYNEPFAVIVTRMLLEAGANPNVKDKEGKTPLDLAQDESVVNLLLEYRATPNRE